MHMHMHAHKHTHHVLNNARILDMHTFVSLLKSWCTSGNLKQANQPMSQPTNPKHISNEHLRRTTNVANIICIGKSVNAYSLCSTHIGHGGTGMLCTSAGRVGATGATLISQNVHGVCWALIELNSKPFAINQYFVNEFVQDDTHCSAIGHVTYHVNSCVLYDSQCNVQWLHMCFHTDKITCIYMHVIHTI
jgi:hypothetical protein